MNKAKVYIAAPADLSWGTVSKFRDKLSSAHIDVKLWERDGKYCDSWLNNADAVIFLLPKLSWGTEYNDLPIGLKRELSRAYAMNKKIFIGYETLSRNLNFYEADVILGTSNDSISGRSGTSSSLKNHLRSFLKISTEIVSEKKIHIYDIETSNPCNEIPFPNTDYIPCNIPIAQKVYATTIPNPDYSERRLLLMM